MRYVVLTFSVPHGCDGSATTGITIQIPEEILSVTPTRNPYYDVEKTMVKLDEPVEDAHGNSVTERVGEVTYTSKRRCLTASATRWSSRCSCPDAAGETLAFPVIQKCQKGETGWTEVPAEGQDEEELEHPAPTVTITEATGDAHGAATTEPGRGHRRFADDSEDGNGLAIVGLVVGAAGVIVGGTALSRTRRQS